MCQLSELIKKHVEIACESTECSVIEWDTRGRRFMTSRND